jgi:hypothetical protein
MAALSDNQKDGIQMTTTNEHLATLREMLADLPETLEASRKKRDALTFAIQTLEMVEAVGTVDLRGDYYHYSISEIPANGRYAIASGYTGETITKFGEDFKSPTEAFIALQEKAR